MASDRGLALRTPTLSRTGDSNTAGEPLTLFGGTYIGGNEAKGRYQSPG